MPFPLAAAITGGVDLINGLLQGSQNRKNRKAQAEENQKARDFNLKMWELNNEYNSPVNQMKRLKEANINPHLAYSNGSPMNTSNAPASSNASSMPAGVAPQMNINGLLQSLLIEEQINNMKADTLKKEAEAKNIGTDTESKTLQNGITTKVLENWQNTYDAEILFKKSATSLNYSNIQVNDKKIEVSDVEIKKGTQEVINMVTENDKVKAEINSIIAKTNLDEQATKNLVATLGLIYAQAKNYESQTALNYETAKNQKFIRANIQAETNNKTELYKALRRGNVVGDAFDFKQKNVDYFKSISAQRQIIHQNVKLLKEMNLLDKRIQAEDIENAVRQFTSPARATKEYIPFMPSSK